MKANRFFSVPYDLKNDVKIRCLAMSYGGVAAVGLWVILLGLLYDQDGLLDMTDQRIRQIVSDALELSDVDGFLEELCSLGLIDSELYHISQHVINQGVLDELEYRKTKSYAGKKGSEKRWGKDSKC